MHNIHNQHNTIAWQKKISYQTMKEQTNIFESNIARLNNMLPPAFVHACFDFRNLKPIHVQHKRGSITIMLNCCLCKQL